MNIIIENLKQEFRWILKDETEAEIASSEEVLLRFGFSTNRSRNTDGTILSYVGRRSPNFSNILDFLRQWANRHGGKAEKRSDSPDFLIVEIESVSGVQHVMVRRGFPHHCDIAIVNA